MRFRKTWRAYQRKILDELPRHLADSRVHLVAPPGSGKTTLGLEIIQRIGKRALVVCPTIAIRDQWIRRFRCDFLERDVNASEWVSTDPRRPAFVTVTTYQGLHAIELRNELAETLHQGQFGTLLADEAHHLRSEWWKTLTAAAEQIAERTLVSLTATPPYDVPAVEWERYEGFCGPVDAEISVPELVLSGDVCPHQDYVYLTLPEPRWLESLDGFHLAAREFIEALRRDATFAQAIARHPWLLDPEAHVAAILEAPQYASSMLIFLRASGNRIPKGTRKVLGIERQAFPDLDASWLETLLTNCLYRDAEWCSRNADLASRLRGQLLRMHAVERRRVTLTGPAEHLKALASAPSKIQGIRDILRRERNVLGASLRALVLTDFIRKGQDDGIGVVPIFNALCDRPENGIRVAAVSGSAVLAPRAALPALVAYGADASAIDCHARDSNLISIKPWAGLVRAFTSLLESGEVNTIVATKALLGEGWDAPFLNTLVLATSAGSYVISNQVRGRCIRADPNCPEKTANIWHVVCVEPGAFGTGPDYELLERRCTAFAGIGAAAGIESGLDRLNLPKPPFDTAGVEFSNGRQQEGAAKRDSVREKWKVALAVSPGGVLAHGVRFEKEPRSRRFIFRRTIASLVAEGAAISGTALSIAGRVFVRVHFQDAEQSFHALETAFGCAAVLGLPWFSTAIWRWLRHRSPESSMEQVGRAVVEALAYPAAVQVHAERRTDGAVFCWISDATPREQSVFTQAITELLGPAENPRYILKQRSWAGWLGENYFPVPRALSQNKETAMFFAQKWGRLVGPASLIFTRTADGRKTLLRARGHSLAAAFQKPAERLSCWK